MTNRPKGRPGGNPSRPGPRQSVESIVQNAMAAGALLPDLTEQFTALGPGLQQRLFRLIDLVGGMSHDEKVEARVQINGIRRFDSTGLEFGELLVALDSLVVYIDRLANPVIDGEPVGNLAERFLDDYAVKNGG